MASIPTALYRLQLLPNYSFKQVQKLLPNMSRLGIDRLFLSSIFDVDDPINPKAAAVDFSQCHPKLGTAEDFSILAQSAKESEIGIVLSVRAAFMQTSLHNRLWHEMLQRGIHAPYARWFDIDWTPFHRKWVNQILLPILEEPYSEAIEKGLFAIQFHAGAFQLKYKSLELPLSYETWWTLVNSWIKVLAEKSSSSSTASLELTGIRNQLSSLCQRDSSDSAFEASAESKEKKNLARRMDLFLKSSGEAQRALKLVLETYNGSSPQTVSQLERLLRLQAYRLSAVPNRVQEINVRHYGRDYSTVALHLDLPEVMTQAFVIPFTMIKHRLIAGICLEQMDLVSKPEEMLKELVERCKKEKLYLLSEEGLVDNFQDFQLSGMRSEESIDRLLALGLEHKKMPLLEETYRKFTGDTLSYVETVAAVCQKLLNLELKSEYLRLCAKGIVLADLHYSWRESTFESLVEGLKWHLIQQCLKTARDPVLEENEEQIAESLEAMESQIETLSLKAFLGCLFKKSFPKDLSKVQLEQMGFFCRQIELFTAKLYRLIFKVDMNLRSHPLACFHGFVGDDYSAYSILQLHDYLQKKQLMRPFEPTLSHSELSLLSEESRARLLVLSEIPGIWEKTVLRWKLTNGDLSAAQEYLLFQLLVATWVPGITPERYLDLQLELLQKTVPNSNLKSNLERLLLKNSPFVDNLDRFVSKLHRPGLYNSLAITFLKLFGPGIPEIFHGSDVWRFGFQGYPTFVGEGDQESVPSMSEMFQDVEMFGIKRELIRRGLEFRKKNLLLLTQGEYVPFTVRGIKGGQTFAFGRKEGRSAVIALVARLYLTLGGNEEKLPIGPEIWEEHHLILDRSFSGNYQELYTGREFRLGGEGGEFSLPLSELLRELPFALLERVP